jgi:polysaccharide biosynthesis transport protein
MHPVPLNDQGRPPESRPNLPVPATPAKAAPPPVLQAGPNALALLQALRRRWGPATALGLILAGAVGAGVWFFLPPPKQSAAAMLYMPVDPETMVYKHPEASGKFDSFQQTQVALLKTRLVLNAALRDPKVANLPVVKEQPDPVVWLEKELRVDFPNGPEIARVSLSGDNAAQLKIVVDAVVDAYLVEVVYKRTQHRDKRLKELTDLYNFYQQNLNRAYKSYRELGREVGPRDLQALALKQRMAQEQFNLAQRDLIRLQSDLRTLRLQEKTFDVKAGERLVVPPNLLDDYAEHDRVLVRHKERKAELQKLIEVNSRRVRDPATDPAIQDKVKELAEVDKAIEARRAEVRSAAEAQALARVRDEGTAGLEHLRRQIAFSEQLEPLLKQETERLAKEAAAINEGSLNIEEFRFQIEMAEATARAVATERNKLEVEQKAPPRVTRMEEAVPYAPENTLLRRGGIAGGSAAGALAVVLLAVAFQEFRARRVSSPEQVGQGLGIRLVGTVPAPPTRTRRLLAGGSEAAWQAILTESVDAVRTLLLHEARGGGIQTVLVTSAVSGEGKTSLSCHLAVRLARAGRKTLLVDGDLRSPSAHKLFFLEPGPGFSELLRGEAAADQVIVQTPADNLSLLPAGRCDRVALQALAQDGVAECLRPLRERFEFVIIDSPPVLPLNDGLLLAQQADGVLFSVLRHVSRLPQVHAAAQRLAALGVRLLGAVVNGTQEDLSRYGARYVQPEATSAPA